MCNTNNNDNNNNNTNRSQKKHILESEWKYNNRVENSKNTVLNALK